MENFPFEGEVSCLCEQLDFSSWHQDWTIMSISRKLLYIMYKF